MMTDALFIQNKQNIQIKRNINNRIVNTDNYLANVFEVF